MSEARSEIVWYLMVEVLLFAFAALAHGGIVMPGHEHARAATAETIIAIILGGGLIVSFANPAQTRIVALITQGLALAGVIIGLSVLLIYLLGLIARGGMASVYHGQRADEQYRQPFTTLQRNQRMFLDHLETGHLLQRR